MKDVIMEDVKKKLCPLYTDQKNPNTLFI